MKVLGWLAMVAAVVAIVVGLVAAVGVWVVEPDLQARAEELLVAADEGLVRADELLDRVDAGVVAATDAVTRLNDAAQTWAGDPLLDDATRTELATSIDGFMTGPYAELQTSYAGLKERVESVSRTLGLIDRMLPGVELPGNLAETLTQVDAAVTSLDEIVTSGAGLLTDTLSGPNASSRIAAQTQRLNEAMVVINDLLPRVDERLATAQVRVADAQEQLGTWFTALAVIVTLLGLYLAGLNVLLFQKGRQWAGRTGTAAG